MKLSTILLIISIPLSCSRTPVQLNDTPGDFDKKRIDKLAELEKSTLKITCSTYYRNYYYRSPENPGHVVSHDSLLVNSNITTNSVAGTGLILYQDLQKQLLVTCHHIFDFEDTLKTYYLDEDRQQTKHLNSLSIKFGQSILVFHKNGRNTIGEIIGLDKINDLALVTTGSDENSMSELPLQSILGDAEKLKLGQEIYLLGFPKGFFMVTRGLVSPSPFKNKFIVDAPFNRGFSGGVVVAFTWDDQPYQFVGLANSIAYNSEYVLAPVDDQKNIDQYQNIPYDGDVYIKDLKMLNYGITYVIKSNFVRDFLKSEEVKLDRMGFKIAHLLN